MSPSLANAVQSAHRRLQVDAIPRASGIVKMNAESSAMAEKLLREMETARSDFEKKAESIAAKNMANNVDETGTLDVKLLKFLSAKILEQSDRETLLGHVLDVAR